MSFEQGWRLFPHTYAMKTSQGRWQSYTWLEYVSMRIALAVRRGRGRIIIDSPPRHGKSEFISKKVPAWFLDTFPNKSVIACSYGDELASGFGRSVRNHFLENPYTIAKLKPDSTAANRFETTTGGTMITAGIGGAITGRGGHLLICDDPYKNWDEASSETYRERVRDWYSTTFFTRQEPGATIILVMTRWHHNDLASTLISEGKDDWELISFPAIAEENDIIGRKIGDALCPERYDIDALMALKEGLPDQYWEALYQQRPGKIEGDIFKDQWWQFYDEKPSFFKKITQYWDTAQKPGITNDYTVCSTYGETENGMYLIDVWRDKVDAPSLEDMCLLQYHLYKPQEVVIEDKASGIGLIQHLNKKTKIPVTAMLPTRDKVQRAISATPFIRSGRVFLPRQAPWLKEFIKEHNQFPNMDHDDQVDTTSMMVEHFNNTSIYKPRVRSL